MLFGQYLNKALGGDADLGQLRVASTAQGEVVGAALPLGTVQLRRAAVASGAERQALLDDVERSFLSIRHDADHLSGGPSLAMVDLPSKPVGETDEELARTLADLAERLLA